jgi:hypothetical protein
MDSDNSNRKRRRETDSLVLEETNKMTTLSRDNSSPKSTSQAMLYSTASTSKPLIKKVDDNNRKKTKIIGKGISSDIKAAEKTFNVFINNVDINDSEEKVVQMFKSNNIEVKECAEFNKRIKKSRAFIVKINAKDKSKIYDPELWPMNIILSKYTFYEKENKTNEYDNIRYRKEHLNSTTIIGNARK